MTTRIGIVGCGKSKARAPAPARDLYTSNLFRLSLTHAERTCARVYVASAYHGLVQPDAVIKPYERKLSDLGGKRDREDWGARTIGAIPTLRTNDVTVVIYAGGHYAEALRVGAWRRGWSFELPLDGLQVGERLAWLKRAA